MSNLITIDYQSQFNRLARKNSSYKLKIITIKGIAAYINAAPQRKHLRGVIAKASHGEHRGRNLDA